jgi:hypothetical protein
MVSWIKSLPYNQLRFVQWHIVINWLPVNNRLFFERGRIPSNLCTLCDEGPESKRYYLFCTKNKRTWENLNKSPRQVLNKHNINPILQKLIYEGLDISIAEELNANGVECELHHHDIPSEYKNLVDTINKAGIYQLWYEQFTIEWDWYQCWYLQKSSAYDTEPTLANQHGYVQWHSQSWITAIKGGELDAITNRHKSKALDSNITNSYSRSTPTLDQLHVYNVRQHSLQWKVHLSNTAWRLEQQDHLSTRRLAH